MANHERNRRRIGVQSKTQRTQEVQGMLKLEALLELSALE